ncbi:MAG: hypothetical protein WAL63_21190 [Solirubrobacteraceae bacterium]
MLLPLATQQSQLHVFVAVLAAGLVIGVFGHIISSRPLIIASILIIGVFSAYFLFDVSHVT